MTHLVKERFLICKTCEHSRSAGFDCVLRTGCCFGRWRTKPESQCPAGRWPAQILPDAQLSGIELISTPPKC